jgi:hypothetical protein
VKSVKILGAVVSGLILLAFASPVLAVGYTSDNFNDNDKSPAWGTDQILEGENVVLTEVNGRLEFLPQQTLLRLSGRGLPGLVAAHRTGKLLSTSTLERPRFRRMTLGSKYS